MAGPAALIPLLSSVGFAGDGGASGGFADSTSLVNVVLEDARRRYTPNVEREPVLGKFLAKGKYGSVFLLHADPGTPSPTPPVWPTASGRVVKVLGHLPYQAPWCVFDEYGNVVFEAGSKRRSACRYRLEVGRLEPERARRFVVGRVNYTKDSSGKVVRLNEFLNEALASLVVTHQLVRPGRALGFVACHDAWRSLRDGYIVMDRCHDTAIPLVPHFRLPDWKAFMMVTLANLAVAQHFLHLKHHDLHTGNVMVTYLRRPPSCVPTPKLSNGIRLRRSTPPVRVGVILGPDLHFECELPLEGSVMPCIADFGMSSWGSEPRVRLANLTHLSGSDSHGEFSGEFGGWRGYDASLLVGNSLYRIEKAVDRTAEREWLRALLKVFLVGGARCNEFGRPVRGRVSDVPPATPFLSGVFDEFRVPKCDPTRCVIVANMTV